MNKETEECVAYTWY